MRFTRRTFKGTLLLMCLTVALLCSGLATIFASAESISSDIGTDSILLHNDTYPGIEKVRNGIGWMYTYSVDEEVFTSEKSEDDVWRKAMFWQYQQELKTIEEIEYEYALYTSRGLLNIPSAEQNPTTYSANSVFNGEITGRLMWQPYAGATYLPLKNMRVELYAEAPMTTTPLAPIKLEESKTDADGNFIFRNTANFWELFNIGSMIMGAKLFCRVYPESDTFKVATDGQSIINVGGEYFSNWQIIDNWLDSRLSYSIVSQTIVISYFNRTGSFGIIQIPYEAMPLNVDDVTEIIKVRRAFIVAQGLVMGQSFVNDHNYFPAHKVYVAYPAFMGTEMDTNAFCYTEYQKGIGLMCIGRLRDVSRGRQTAQKGILRID